MLVGHSTDRKEQSHTGPADGTSQVQQQPSQSAQAPNFRCAVAPRAPRRVRVARAGLPDVVFGLPITTGQPMMHRAWIGRYARVERGCTEAWAGVQERVTAGDGF